MPKVKLFAQLSRKDTQPKTQASALYYAYITDLSQISIYEYKNPN